MATKNTFGLGPLERIEQEYMGLGMALQNQDRGIAADQQTGTAPDQQPQPKVDTRQPASPNRGGGASGLLPPQNFVSLFEQSARKHNVPVNVLMALAQQESTYNPNARGEETKWGRAKGMMQYLDSTAKMMGINPYNVGQSIDAAAKQIRQRLDKGYSMEDAVKEHFAGPDRRLWGPKTRQYGIDVLGKASKIREQLYGNTAPVEAAQPTLEPGTPEYDARVAEQMSELDAATAAEHQQLTAEAGDPIVELMPEPLADFTKQIVGGGYKATGSGIRGIGAIPKIIGDYTTTPLVNMLLGTDYTTKNMLDVPAELVSKYGDAIQEGVSDATKQAIKDSTPDGDLFDPSTWTFGDKPSALGYLALGADVLGQMLPIIASSVATGGQSALAQMGTATIVGGAQGGGAAIEEARDLVDKMATTFVGEGGGLTLLEKESPYYRELLASGKSPEKALELTKDAAERMAYIMTFPVSGAGGVATSRILHPATNILSRQNIAARVGGRAALGALEEGTQEAMESVQTRQGINTAIGTDLNITEDTFGDFVLGAIAGGKTGAAGGAFSRRQQSETPTVTDPETGTVYDTYSDGLGDEVRVPREGGEAPFVATGQDAGSGPSRDEPVDQEATPEAEQAEELGPISRALKAGEDAAQSQQASRVVVATPVGELTGFLEGYQEDGQGGFVARVLGDDGRTHQFTHNDEVVIQPLDQAPQPAEMQARQVAFPDAIDEGTSVEVVLADGEVLEGIAQYYDSHESGARMELALPDGSVRRLLEQDIADVSIREGESDAAVRDEHRASDGADYESQADQSAQKPATEVTTDLGETISIPAEYSTLFDDQAKPLFANAQSVRAFKQRTGVGQPGFRAIQKSVLDGSPITIEEARAIDEKAQARRSEELEKQRIEADKESQKARSRSAGPRVTRSRVGEFEVPGIDGTVQRVAVYEYSDGSFDAVGISEGAGSHSLTGLIKAGASVEEAIAQLYGDHSPDSDPDPSKVRRIVEPKPVSNMSIFELNERLDYLHTLAKTNNGWSKRMTREKKRVEDAIAKLKDQEAAEAAQEKGTRPDPADSAVVPRASEVTTPQGKPLVELFHPNSGTHVLVRKDHWESDRERMPTFNRGGVRAVGQMMEVDRDTLSSPVEQGRQTDQQSAPTESMDTRAEVDGVVEPDIPEHAYSDADGGSITQRADGEIAPQSADEEQTYAQAQGDDSGAMVESTRPAPVSADTDQPVAKKRARKKSEPTRAERRAREIIGAEPGDVIMASGNVGYINSGQPMQIESITKKGVVHVLNPSSGGRTTLNMGELEGSVVRGIAFTKQPAAPQATAPAEPRQPVTVSREPGITTIVLDPGAATRQSATQAESAPQEPTRATADSESRQMGPGGFTFLADEQAGKVQSAFAGMEVESLAIGGSRDGFLNFGEQYPDGRYRIASQGATVGFDGKGRWETIGTDNKQSGSYSVDLEPSAEIVRVLSDLGAKRKPNTTGDALSNDLNSLFSKNTIFTADKVEAARARLRSKLGQLNSGIDPEALIDGMTIAGAYIEGGVRSFNDYAKRMISDLGDGVKPYLLSFWEGARNYPGLSTDDMTSVEDSRKAFDAMMTPADSQTQVVGEVQPKPRRRTPKTGRGGDRTLVQDWGVDHIDGYGESYDRETGNSVKDEFLKDARSYLTQVSKELSARGYTSHTGKNGKLERPISVNKAGAAVSGDVSLSMIGPGNTGIYVSLGGSSLRGVVPTTTSGVAILYRTTTESDKFGTRSTNNWAPVDLSATDFAGMLDALVQREETRNERRNEQGVQAPDRTGVPEAGSRREHDAQQDTPQFDFGDLEARQPENVGEPAARENREPVGIRSSRADVEPAGGTDQVGNAGDGRARAGGTRTPDAGTGSAGSTERRGRPSERVATTKKPETVSPANEGAGDFVITDPLKIVGGGQVARFEKNQRAIELRNQLQDEGRKPTAAEQEVLAGYTGWGSFGQELFQGTWDNPKPRKGWEARDAWLRENLGQAEWEGMQRSIINAHYTDPPTVMAMWDMVKRLGFDGGRVLEPSIGIGNFFGMMPPSLAARSERAGIELDPVTGSMAQMLYPKANIQIRGYETSTTPDNFYDLVIGNWPFADISPADRRYNRIRPMLHDYFFLKALDQTRPGGIVIGITSRGTMDKKDSRVRTELAKKGELLAAFRLPSGAFEEYAGTSVVTDILVLRKRAEPAGVVAGEGWIRTKPHPTKEGTPVDVNEYYHANPQHVIGEIDFGSGTTSFRPGQIVHRPDDMMAQLQRIVNLVPEGAYQKDTRGESISYIANHTSDRTNSLVKTDDGLFVVQGEYLAPANEVLKYQVKNEKTTADREAQLGALVDMRKLYGELIEAERNGDADAQRTALRSAYEGFKKKHKGYSDSYGLNYLRRIDDPFYPALAALEVERTVDGKTTFEPAAILSESTVRGRARIESPSIADAFVLARNESVNPSPERIAEISGQTVEAVKAELLSNGAAFETPGGDFVPADMYLSGNVREKLRQAKAGLEEGNTAMERNIKALEEVIPEDIPYFKIETQMGATWVPASTYADYVAHMLGLENSNSITASFQAGAWKIDFPSAHNSRTEAQNGFGTVHVPFKRLVNAAISNQTITVRRKDADGSEYVDAEASQEVNARIADMRLKFGEWLWSDPERRVDLEQEYNETRNSYATPSFDGSFLTFEGMALSLGNGPFNLRKHQADAIWRALVTKKSLNAHEVGTGKTFTMGGIAVESRRYGIAKKPLLFAHNANSKTVAAEIQQMYPAAKILYVDNLAKGNIKTRMMQIANDDWDVVVFPHSLIDRIGFKEETLMDMAQQQLDELEQAAREAAQDDGADISEAMLTDDEELKKLRSVTAKQLVKQRMRILETVQKLAQQASREDSIAFEDLGVDMVLVDEAHEFKKPPIATKMKIKGLQTQTSNRSISMSFITRYVRGMNNGGNVHLFTGTPITNTMTEVFHMMRYMMQEEMEANGLADWDGWFGSFAREVEDVELSSTGEYETITRLQSFINVPELRRMIGQYMDVVFAEDMPEMQPRRINGKTLNDPSLTEAERAELINGRTEGARDRPYKMVVNESADMSPEQLRVFGRVQRLASEWRKMTGKERREAMSRGDDVVPIIYDGIAERASFDVRLVDAIENAGKEGTPEMAPHPDSKPARVVKNLIDIYNSHEKAAQVVFMEQGMGTSVTRSEGEPGEKKQVRYKAFSTLNDMIERLVQAGIPREEIAAVTGSTSKDRRAEIAEAMNDGRIRIVFGSTDSLGVGVNMQRNLRAMHHMDAPWMPGELEQRNGRGQRQGNQWNTVKEYRYLTDRLDGRRWQVLAIKQRFITDFMKSKGEERVIEGDAASDEQGDILSTFADAAGDPRILVREKLRKKVEALQSRERLHSHAQADAARQSRRLQDEIRSNTQKLDQLRKSGAPKQVAALISSQQGDGFRATILGQSFDSSTEARNFVRDRLPSEIRIGQDREIGTYGNARLHAIWGQHATEPSLYLEFGDQVIESRGSSLPSLAAALRDFRDNAESTYQNRIEQQTSTLARMQQVASEPFHLADELANTERQLANLEADISENPVAPPHWLRSGAPVDTTVMWQGKEFEVSGHRWNKDGWFVLAEDGEGTVAIPYLEAKDQQGMPLYEEHAFTAPEVIKQEAPPTDADAVPAEQPGEVSYSVKVEGENVTATPHASEALRRQKPMSIRSTKAQRDMATDALRTEAYATLRGVGTMHHPDVGDITVNRRGWSKSRANSTDRAKILTIDKLPDIIRTGTLLSTSPASGRTGGSFHHIGRRLVVDGVPVTALVTVEQAADGTTAYYNHTIMADLEAKTGRDAVDGAIASYRRPTLTATRQSRTEALPARHASTMKALTSGPLGSLVNHLIGSGHVVIHPNERSLPRSIRIKGGAAIQGFTESNGTIHLVAESLTPQTAMPVLLHEAFHAQGENLLGGKKWRNLMGQLGRYHDAAIRREAEGRIKEGDFWDGALRRLESARQDGAINEGRAIEEFGAYAIENYELAPSGIKKWVDNLIGLVKDWLYRRFGIQAGAVTPAQLRALSIAALRQAQNTTPQTSRALGGMALGSGPLSAEYSGLLTDVLATLAGHDEFFRYPRATGRSLSRVIENFDEPLRFLGTEAILESDQNEHSGAVRRHVIRTDQNKDAWVFEDDDNKVWLDISRLAPGEGGSAVYAAVANYAHNTGKVFIGDPKGLTDEALYRRTEAMLNSALKFETTDHIAPHEYQLRGNVTLGVPPLKWQAGKHLENLRSMIDVVVQTVENNVPESRLATFDFRTRTFRTGEGQPLTDEHLEGWLPSAGKGRTLGIGSSSIKRAVLYRQLSQVESGEGPGLLERVFGQSAKLVAAGSPLNKIGYSVTEKREALDEAIKALEEADKPIDRAAAESLIRGDFVGQAINDMTGARALYTRFFAHPYQIASMYPEFTPVFETATLQHQARNEIIEDLHRDHAVYQSLPAKSKAAVNKVIELGRLAGQSWTRDQLEQGVTNRGYTYGIAYDENGEPRRVRKPFQAQLSGEGEILSLTAPEIDAYLKLREMFDRALDMFRDQFLTEMGLEEYINQPDAAKTLMQQASTMSGEEATRLSNAAQFINDIEQSKRTGYVPLARYGDYVVAVKERQFDIKYVVNDSDQIVALNVPDHLTETLDRVGAYFDPAEQAWIMDEWQRDELERANEETVYSEKVETGIRDMFGRNSERNVKMRKGAVSEIPAVKKAIERVITEQVGDNAMRRVVTFETSKKRPDGQIDLSSLDALAEVAMLDQPTWEAVRGQLAKAMQSGGFRKHFFQSGNVAGYSADFERSIADYIVGLSGYLARRQFNNRWDKAVADVKGENLHRYATKYREYVNQPGEELAMLRQTGFFLYIAGNISSAILNATQVALMTMPFLSMITSHPRATAEVLRAYKDAIKLIRANRKTGFDIFDFSKAPIDVREDLLRASAEGLLLPLQSLEIMGIASRRSVEGRRLQKGYDNVVQTAALPFTASERLNRVVTFIAANRLAKKSAVKAKIDTVFKNNPHAQTMIGGEAFSPYSFAEFAVDETQFRMGKANRPTAMRGVGTSIMQFKSFMLQFFEAMYRNYTLHGKEGKKAALATTGMLVAMSGMWGAPGADDLRELFEGMYRGITKRDLDTRTELRRWVYETTNSQFLTSLLDGGVPYALGADMSRRIGLGQVMPDTQDPTGIPWLDTMVSIGGIPADMLIGRPIRSAQALGTGDTGAAATSLLPNFIENARKAKNWSEEGVRTGSGRMVLPAEDVNTSSVVMKAIGVQPSQISDVYAYGRAQRRSQSSADKLKREYMSDYVRALGALARNTDPSKTAKLQGELSAIIADIAKQNESLPPHQRITINRASIRRQMQTEMGGVQAGFGRERKAARGDAAGLREVFGVQ